MVKRIIKITLGVLLSIILLGIGAVSANSEDDKIISYKKTNEFQLSENVIVERTLNGENLDTEYTKVTLIEDEKEGTKTIEIDKVLSETVYQSGEIETDNEKTAIIFSSSNGSHNETHYPDSRTASVRVDISYNTRTISGHRTIKMSSFKVTPRNHDSQFRLTRLTYEARSAGEGFLLDGTQTNRLETTGSRLITSPTSGQPYTRSISSWVKYLDRVHGGATGVNGTLTYQRISNNRTTNFHYSTGVQ